MGNHPFPRKRRLFSSYNLAMANKRKFAAAQELEIAQLYQSGSTIYELTEKFGGSGTSIRNVLVRQGIQVRPRNYERPETWTFCGCGSRAIYTAGVCRRCYDQERNSDPEVRERRYNWKLKRYFNISREKYDRLLDSQGGVCAICGRYDPRDYRLAIDHDHKCCPGTGSCGSCIRGLLCVQCNVALGALKDSLENAESLVRYLRANR
jgi:Recombination endonuclease VII